LGISRYGGRRGKVMMDGGDSDVRHDDDMPEYSLRVSARARRMQLKVTPWGEVEVVVPRHMAISRVPPFVQEHRQWLQRTLARVRALHHERPALVSLLPERVHLAALGEEWRVDYTQGVKSRVTAIVEGEGRVLQVETVADVSPHLPLQIWLHDHARRHLLPWLQTVSEECRLPFVRATVRAQKTRWGSCSARGHISLNRHLLFLPPQSVRYLFIHELCHTVHLNHSRRYWSLVGRHAPDYGAREAELRRAAHQVPLWACAQ